jgi:hypothetical protein
MWDWETMDKATALFGIMGFQPTEMNEMYELSADISDSATAFSTFGDTDADVILRIMNLRMLDASKLEESQVYAKIINAMLKKYGPKEQRALVSQIFNKAMKRKYDQDNLVGKWFDEVETRTQDDLNLLNSIVARKLGERK